MAVAGGVYCRGLRASSSSLVAFHPGPGKHLEARFRCCTSRSGFIKRLTAFGLGRDVGYFLTGTFVSSLGNGIQVIASAYLALTETESVTAVGGLFILVAIPGAVLSTTFGRLADRLNRRWLCIASDLFRGTAAALVPIALWLDIESLWIIYFASFLIALGDTLFIPASNAMMQEIVPESGYQRYSAIYETTIQAGALLSVAIGGFFVEWFGAATVLAFNALTFLLSAVLIGLIRYRSATQNRATASQAAAARPTTFVRHYLQGPTHLLSLGLMFALVKVIVTLSNVLLVPLVIQDHGDGMDILGLTDAFAGVGMFCAGLVAARVIGVLGKLKTLLWGFVGCGLLLALLPHGDTLWVIAFTAANAVFFGHGRIALRSWTYEVLPYREAGTFFGFFNGVGLVAAGIATFFIARIGADYSLQWAYLTLCLLILTVTLSTMAALNRLALAPPAKADELLITQK